MTVAGFRVVDAHVHVQPWDQLKDDVDRVMTRGRGDRAAIDRYIEEPEAFTRFLDDEGVERAALINYPAPEVMGFDETVNDYVADYRDRHPDRIIAFGGLHPHHAADAEARAARLVSDLRVDGVKVHPPHQLVRANAHAEGNTVLAALYEACQAARVPVMIHTGTSIFPGARGKFGDPMDCDDIAVDFPDLPLILAHGGRPIWMSTAVHLVRRHPNVHLDLSGIPPQSLLDYFPALERIADSCLFGTDWPSPGVRSIRANVEALLRLPLSDEAKAALLSGTADRLFPPRAPAA